MALMDLAEEEGGTERIEKAIEAFNAAKAVAAQEADKPWQDQLDRRIGQAEELLRSRKL